MPPEGCQPVKYRGGFIPIIEYVKGSGRYCVMHDFVQRNIKDLIDGRNRGSPGQNGVLSFFKESKNLDLDLRGHLISSAPFEDSFGVYAPYKNMNDLRVYNGTIVTPGLRGVGVFMASHRTFGYSGILPEDESPMRKIEYLKSIKEWEYSDPWDYKPLTRYTAENLVIKSGGRGVVMAGADNVLRNNTIEVDGHTAVYMYGPRPIIEGNTFIVHLDSRDKAVLPAMLKLRDADGAIIRNNRFIVHANLSTGLFRDKSEAAINLLKSKDVVIENNMIEDTRMLVRQDAFSSTIERNNQIN